MSPASSTDCLDPRKHRLATAAEYLDKNTVMTEITAADSSNYPAGAYAIYLSQQVGDLSIVRKFGSFNLKNCSVATTTAVAQSCSWQQTNPQFVVGGGNTILPTGSCNINTKGTTGIGYYDMGSGNRIQQNYQCVCK